MTDDIFTRQRIAALLGEGTQWATEVERYLQKHHLDAYRDKIFQRVKGD